MPWRGMAGARPEGSDQIAALDKRIATITRAIDSIIGKDVFLLQKRRAKEQTTGVGPATSLTLAVTFPELGTLNSRQAAALAGLAPSEPRQRRGTGQTLHPGGMGQAAPRALHGRPHRSLPKPHVQHTPTKNTWSAKISFWSSNLSRYSKGRAGCRAASPDSKEMTYPNAAGLVNFSHDPERG